MATAPSGSEAEARDDRDPALGLPNQWYVALPSSLLTSESRSVRIAGRAVKLWRGLDGAVASDGLRVVEQDHYVWAHVGPEEPTGLPAPLTLFQRRGYACSQRTVRVRAEYRWVLENSLDFSHGAIAHPFTQPSWLLQFVGGLPPLEASYASTPDGLVVEGRLGGLHVFTHSFMLPDRLRLVILPGSPCEVEIVVLHVPVDRRECRMEVALARRAWPWEGRTPRFHPESLLVHRQDVAILEAQQAALDSGVCLPERHCEADAYTLLLRRILAAARQGGWQPESGRRTLRMRVSRHG